MIPEWMDLILWGHEHECLIDPVESLVGTFRVSQPGSSVATSLCMGESTPKQAGLLEIRGDNFRMSANPLSKVRGFAMGEVSMMDFEELNPEDPKIDDKVTKVLVAKVKELINEAREKTEVANEAAESHRQTCGMEDDGLQPEYDLSVPERGEIERGAKRRAGNVSVGSENYTRSYLLTR